MNQKQKKILIIVLALVVVIAIIAAVVIFKGQNKEPYVRVEEDGTRVNTSEKLAEAKTYKGLEFSNIKFVNSSGVTNLTADVKNATENDMPAQSLNINVLDKSGNIITTFAGVVAAVRAGETTMLSAAIGGNYTNAYDIEIVD